MFTKGSDKIKIVQMEFIWVSDGVKIGFRFGVRLSLDRDTIGFESVFESVKKGCI